MPVDLPADGATGPDRPGPRRRTGVVAVVGACAVLPWLLLGHPASPGPPAATAVPSARELTVVPLPTTAAGRRPVRGTPLAVRIPRLGVATDVQPISGSSGVLVPPSDPQRIGWWREGAVVGDAHGAVVLTGHTVSSGGGAFDRLGALRGGDGVVVRTSAGLLRYVVRSVHDYPVADFARRAPVLLGARGRARLVLVTCSGFDGRRYRASTVVVAVPVGTGARPGST